MSLSRDERSRVEEALRNPDGTDVIFSLNIEGLGVDVGEDIFAGNWGADNTGVISTDLTFSGRLPLDYDDAKSVFSLYVEDIEIPQMVGHVSLPEIVSDKAATQFYAASAGAEAGRVDLADMAEDIGGGINAIEFNGWTPDRVVRRILRKLPYPSSMVRVDALKEPLLYLTYARQNNFWPEQFVSDVLSVVRNQTPYTLRDTAEGGFVATPTLELSEVSRDVGRIYSAEDFIQWRPPPRSETRYSEVVVFKRNDAGIDLFEPARATVPYRSVKRPLASAAKYISLDDESPEAPERARQLAHTMASSLSRGVFADDSAILPYFDPLIEIGAPIWVDEEWEDMAGFWDRSWLLWVDSYRHDYVSLHTEISYTAALMENERIESPAFIMPGVSDGVARLLWGEYGQSYFYIDESVPWITDNGDYFTIDETLSGGVVTVSGDYFTVN